MRAEISIEDFERKITANLLVIIVNFLSIFTYLLLTNKMGNRIGMDQIG